MAKPNYSFQKRQREIAKKQKKEEKKLRKQEGGEPDAADAGVAAEAPDRVTPPEGGDKLAP